MRTRSKKRQSDPENTMVDTNSDIKPGAESEPPAESAAADVPSMDINESSNPSGGIPDSVSLDHCYSLSLNYNFHTCESPDFDDVSLCECGKPGGSTKLSLNDLLYAATVIESKADSVNGAARYPMPANSGSTVVASNSNHQQTGDSPLVYFVPHPKNRGSFKNEIGVESVREISVPSSGIPGVVTKRRIAGSSDYEACDSDDKVRVDSPDDVDVNVIDLPYAGSVNKRCRYCATKTPGHPLQLEHEVVKKACLMLEITPDDLQTMPTTVVHGLIRMKGWHHGKSSEGRLIMNARRIVKQRLYTKSSRLKKSIRLALIRGSVGYATNSQTTVSAATHQGVQHSAGIEQPFVYASQPSYILTNSSATGSTNKQRPPAIIAANEQIATLKLERHVPAKSRFIPVSSAIVTVASSSSCSSNTGIASNGTV